LPLYAPTAPYYPPDYADSVMKESEKSLAVALNRAEKAGVQASGLVKDGNAAEVILDAARGESADLIVMGRRGMSKVERFLMGSVSSSVVDHSKCDVLIVK